MGLGIPGYVGEYVRKQQADDLAQQLQQQMMAERIRQFDAEQRLQRERLAQDERQHRETVDLQDRARRDRMNAEGVQDMNQQAALMERQTERQQEQDRIASKDRAASNLAGLIPMIDRKTPQGRQEITGQLARIDPKSAASMALEPTEEEKQATDDAAWKRRADYSEAQLRSRPHRDPVPIVVQTPTGLQVVDREAKTAEPVTDKSGADIPLVPTAEQRNRQAARGNTKVLLDSVAELSDRINVNQGVYAKAVGEVQKQQAKINLDDDVAEYEAMVQAFTPIWARALGHVGVLTQQDVDSARAALPRPGDSKSLKDRKLARIDKIISGMGGQQQAAPGGAPAPAAPTRLKFDAQGNPIK